MRSFLLLISLVSLLAAQGTDSTETMVVEGSDGPVKITIPQDTVQEETARAKPVVYAFQKGTNVVSAGTAFAFGTFYAGAFGGNINYDHAITDNISLGVGYTNYFRDGTDEMLLIPSGRLGFHFLSIESLKKYPVSNWCDLYAVLDMGPRIHREGDEVTTILNFGVPIGVRVYFTTLFGLQIESDWDDMMLSLAFRF